MVHPNAPIPPTTTVTVLDIQPHDVLVLRCDSKERELAAALQEELRRTHPSWVGTLLVLPVEVDLLKLPPDVAADLYLRLRKVFEPAAAQEPATRVPSSAPAPPPPTRRERRRAARAARAAAQRQ